MTMEGNKDEAERCIEVAEVAFRFGNVEKAEKFLVKAERLYPSARAKALLTRVRATASSGSATKRTPPSSPDPEDVRRRKTPAHQPPQRDFTQDQQDAVKRINTKCKDYYEILGVTKEATDSDIKKAYKKLALQLHPDKNHAPGAAEAFKAIGNAVAILTDPEKRKQYDLRGDEPSLPHHQPQYYGRGFESDLTAEELFNMFFGASEFQNGRARPGTRDPVFTTSSIVDLMTTRLGSVMLILFVMLTCPRTLFGYLLIFIKMCIVIVQALFMLRKFLFRRFVLGNR